MKALLLDTETTGLIDNHVLPLHKQASIIEFYGVLADLSTGQTISELELLINPQDKLPEEIVKITGITDDMLKGMPPFDAVADQVFSFIESAPVVIGHNLSFDCEVLDIEAERLGRSIKWPTRLCSVEQSIWLKGFRLSLSSLHELLFEEGFADAHRAKPDTQALLRCCTEMYNRRWL